MTKQKEEIATARTNLEAVNKKIMEDTKQLEKDKKIIREQLEDLNLFNAKLLYVNKLLQNKNLSESAKKSVLGKEEFLFGQFWHSRDPTGLL